MKLEVYSDGSAEEHVGRPGAWAFVVVRSDVVVASGQGAVAKTTSLHMEIEGALAGLRSVICNGWHADHEVVLRCDSRVVLEIAAGDFVPKPEQYLAISRALRDLARESKASTKWVRGHSGHRWNDHVDGLAQEARLAAKAQLAARKRR